MRVDTRTVLTDFLSRITRGEIVSEREQRNVLEVCARVADDALLEELVKLVSAERAAPQARVSALEIVSAHRPGQAVELAGKFLREVDIEVQRAVLRQASRQWFRDSDELVERVAELATTSARPEVQMDAQRALVELPVRSPTCARALLRIWLDESDKSLRNMFRTRAAELAVAGNDPVAKSLDVLVEAVAARDGDEDDWLLLGRVRREGGGVSTQRLPVLRRIWLSAMSHKLNKADQRPTMFRCAALSLLSVLVVSAALVALGFSKVEEDELAGFTIVAGLLAAATSWLLGRFAVPASLVPERGSLIPVEVAFAGFLSMPFALIALTVVEDTISSGDATGEQLVVLFFAVLAAFGFTRVASLAAYGLAGTTTNRWRLQSVFAAVSGWAVLALTCALDPVPRSSHEMMLLLISAPALLSVSMVYATLDNMVRDHDASERRSWRRIALTPALFMIVLMPLLWANVFEVRVFEVRVETDPGDTRSMNVDRIETDPATPETVPFGREFEVRSSYRQTVMLVAEYDTDIALSVRPMGATPGEYTEPFRADDSVGNTEELRYAFSPGTYLVCVDRFDGDCARDGVDSAGEMDLDEFAGRLDARLLALRGMSDTRAPGVATLTLREGIPVGSWQRLKEVDDWLEEIGAGYSKTREPQPASGYFIALRDLEMQGSADAESIDGTRALPVQTQAPVTGAASDAGATVRIAKRSLLFRADAKQPFTVVLGSTWPAVSSVRPRRVPETLRALPAGVRPNAHQLDALLAALDLTEPPGWSRSESSALLAVLRKGDEAAVALYESLAFRSSNVTNMISLPTYVAVLDTFRSVGAGIFRVQSANRQGALSAALVYGWHLFETETECFDLESGYVVLEGESVEQTWIDLVDILYARAGELHTDELRVGRYPASAADCSRSKPWTNSVERYTALQGRFLRQFGIDLGQRDQPPQFRDFYVVTEEIGGHYDFLPRGTIVRGSEWIGDGEPQFEIIYGYSKCGGSCYSNYGAMAHLGAEYRPLFDRLPDEFRQKWTPDERKRYQDSELVDYRPAPATR